MKPTGSGKMIDVRSIPLGTKGAIDLSERKRDGAKKNARERERERKNDVDP